MDSQEIDARIFAAEDALFEAEEEYGRVLSEMFPGLHLDVHRRA